MLESYQLPGRPSFRTRNPIAAPGRRQGMQTERGRSMYVRARPAMHARGRAAHNWPDQAVASYVCTYVRAGSACMQRVVAGT